LLLPSQRDFLHLRAFYVCFCGSVTTMSIPRVVKRRVSLPRPLAATAEEIPNPRPFVKGIRTVSQQNGGLNVNSGAIEKRKTRRHTLRRRVKKLKRDLLLDEIELDELDRIAALDKEVEAKILVPLEMSARRLAARGRLTRPTRGDTTSYHRAIQAGQISHPHDREEQHSDEDSLSPPEEDDYEEDEEEDAIPNLEEDEAPVAPAAQVAAPAPPALVAAPAPPAVPVAAPAALAPAAAPAALAPTPANYAALFQELQRQIAEMKQQQEETKRTSPSSTGSGPSLTRMQLEQVNDGDTAMTPAAIPDGFGFVEPEAGVAEDGEGYEPP